MPINFDDLNKELHDDANQKPILPPGVSAGHVDEAIAGIEMIRQDIKQSIIEFVKQINRATMKAKDLEPNSSEFNHQVDIMQHNLNGIMSFSGSMVPYTTMQEWMRKMKGSDVK